MSKLFESLMRTKGGREKQENEVVIISALLITELGITTSDFNSMDNGDRINCGKYDILKTCRCFTNGWVDVLEIVPEGAGDPGYVGESQAPWIKEAEGTTTINIPPQDVINEVTTYIKTHN